ncbi:MAG: RDD family protein [Pseudomonadota bacterium]
MTVPARRGAWLLLPATRWVTPEELNVAPALLGQQLARPWRRLLAMGVDLATIGIVSSLSNFWLLAACALGIYEHSRAQRRAPPPWRLVAAGGLVLLMALAGLWDLVDELGRPSPARVVQEGDDEDSEAREIVADALAEAAPALALAASAVASAPALAPTLAASAPMAASASASTPAPAPVDAAATITSLQAEVRRLKRQLARERDAAEEAAAAEHWRERLRRLGLEFGIGYGWALVYFTMLPVWWRGQTVGKRLLGLRMVELTGKPMTPLLSFRRFGGYLASMATGGLGFLQLLWDPNRQALQDKAAHTVVLIERLPRRARPVAEPAPPRPEPTPESGP